MKYKNIAEFSVEELKRYQEDFNVIICPVCGEILDFDNLDGENGTICYCGSTSIMK